MDRRQLSRNLLHLFIYTQCKAAGLSNDDDGGGGY
jgi:hypothetical protein